jgi:hypothetical protein
MKPNEINGLTFKSDGLLGAAMVVESVGTTLAGLGDMTGGTDYGRMVRDIEVYVRKKGTATVREDRVLDPINAHLPELLHIGQGRHPIFFGVATDGVPDRTQSVVRWVA